MLTRKYKNTKIKYEGIIFDSKLEQNIYCCIKEYNIKHLIKPKYMLQEKFILKEPNKKNKTFRAIEYIGDFDLFIDGVTYTIDAKGMETPVFKLKSKLFAKRYNRQIITIKSCKAFREWYNVILCK